MSDLRISRRAFLAGLGALAVARPVLAHDGGHLGEALAGLAPDTGAGRTVAVIGAGLAGLSAAYYLARAGFAVTVLEAETRYGGRSLTLRPAGDPYRRYFSDRYGIDETTYVDRFQEEGGPLQICRFNDDGWNPETEAYPEELFLNAGPGRIPSFHIALLDLCREIGVELEPFIFASRSNLVQVDGFNGGKPVQLRRLDTDLRGEVAELLDRLARNGDLKGRMSPEALAELTDFLRTFGALELSGNEYVYRGSDRAGYAVLPGAWRQPGSLYPPFDLDEMLMSRVWDKTVYNDLRIYWQSSLMQPKGGMDMIWQRLLRRPAGDGTVQGLVRLGRPVTGIRNLGEEGIEVSWGGENAGGGTFDFCVSTMAPNLLSSVLEGFPAPFVNALGEVDQMSACKVGWQAKSRFWEVEDQIFGGISWTHHPISQIWYPADNYLGRTGVLTGAYNRGDEAAKFAKLSNEQRLELALEGGALLHEGFRDKVYVDRGVSIAWENMPHQVAGWAAETAEEQPDVYEAITDLPQGRLYLAGDFVSYMPGWMEGAVRSAQLAADAIAQRVAAR